MAFCLIKSRTWFPQGLLVQTRWMIPKKKSCFCTLFLKSHPDEHIGEKCGGPVSCQGHFKSCWIWKSNCAIELCICCTFTGVFVVFLNLLFLLWEQHFKLNQASLLSVDLTLWNTFKSYNLSGQMYDTSSLDQNCYGGMEDAAYPEPTIW